MAVRKTAFVRRGQWIKIDGGPQRGWGKWRVMWGAKQTLYVHSPCKRHEKIAEFIECRTLDGAYVTGFIKPEFARITGA